MNYIDRGLMKEMEEDLHQIIVLYPRKIWKKLKNHIM